MQMHLAAAPMRSIARLMLACGVVAAVGCGVVPEARATPAAPNAAIPASPRLAILVLAPYLTFEDLSPAETPALWHLASRGAVGAMNARTADRGRPTTASGALTISAGRWASVPIDAPASAADIVALQAANASALTRPVLGALGTAVRDQGGLTGSISVGEALDDASIATRRPAELAAMDASGNVGTNLELTQAGWSDATARLLVVDSPALMLAGESTTMTPAQSRLAHVAAVAELDDAMRLLLRIVDADTFWLVVAPATVEHPREDPAMGPAIAAGRGLRGTLTSSSTRRDGIITNLDVAPTLLDALDLKRPEVMIGAAITADPSSRPLGARILALSAADRAAGAVDRLRNVWFIHVFVALSLIATGFAVWVVHARTRSANPSPASLADKVAQYLLLLVCAMPPAAWLMFLAQPRPTSAAEAAGAFGLATAVVLLGLTAVRRIAGRDSARPLRAALAAPLAASILTTIVILGEQWLGAPTRAGLLSYSVRSGWRYYGMGNEGAALLVSASIIAVGLSVEWTGDSGAGRALRRLGLPVVGLVVTATASAPFAGANAGVAVWGVVAFGVAWAALNGMRVTRRVVAVIGLLIALMVVAVTAVDLSSGSTGGTHLARFASGVASGDLTATGEMVSRKLANNLGYFVVTTYTLLFLGMAGVFALLRPGSSSHLRHLVTSLGALRGALSGVFVGGLVALVTEDSGSVMPALMWTAAIVPTLMIALTLALPPAEPEA